MNGPAALFLGLIGYPLHHSLSPTLHRAALQECGLEGVYDLYPVEPGNLSALAALIGRLRSGSLHGLNVTIPHKQNVLPFVDRCTSPALAIGAVNTLLFEDGLLVGDNTDAPGFMADLNHHYPAASGDALILGGGGAARAVVYALQTSGWHVSLAARSGAQSAALRADFPELDILPLTPAGLAAWKPSGPSLIVNASSAGMTPHMEISPWPEGQPFPREAFVYDLVYNPAETALLKAARRAGLQGCSGLGMLVEQAALAFECWASNQGILINHSPRLAMRQAVRIE